MYIIQFVLSILFVRRIGLFVSIYPLNFTCLAFIITRLHNNSVGRPFRVAIPGTSSGICKAKALPYVHGITKTNGQ